MIYKELLPTNLHSYISKFWYIEATRGHKLEKIFPTPYAHLIINLSDGYKLMNPSGLGNTNNFLDGIISRVQQTPLVISNPRIVRNIGAEFKPFALPAFFNMPDNITVTSSLNAGLDVTPLKKQVLSTDNIDKKLQLLETFLEEHLNPMPNQTLTKLISICNQLQQPKSNVSMIPQTIGMSHRTCIDLIKKYTGLTLKNLHDIYSFQLCLEAIGDNRFEKWSTIMSQLDYFDQPHFIKIFKKYTGFTPTEYNKLLVKYGADYVNFIALDQSYKK